MRRIALFIALVMALPTVEMMIVPPDPVYADSHRRARDAVGRGEIQPLERVLAGVRSAYPGRVMDVDLRQRGDSWTYYIKLLTPDDAMMSINVDARTGRILSVSGGRR